ncbi:MAG TPA: hypothetical protein VHV29_06205 [Terriglobales bacterium]|jgi:hypothetical protein|nr:hypothetical protein [Terriglobales bacterium]
MKGLTVEEARGWCAQVGPQESNGVLRYETSNQDYSFFVLAPETFREITILARAMLVFRGDANFYGGLLWLRRWDIGSPQLVHAGWRIMEEMRGAHGEPRSLEMAPAQLFREDELTDLHVFLIQVIGFGLVADLVPTAGSFFVHFKDNRQVCFTCESMELLNELRTTFTAWNPTDHDPMILRIAELEPRRTT